MIWNVHVNCCFYLAGKTIQSGVNRAKTGVTNAVETTKDKVKKGAEDLKEGVENGKCNWIFA